VSHSWGGRREGVRRQEPPAERKEGGEGEKTHRRDPERAQKKEENKTGLSKQKNV